MIVYKIKKVTETSFDGIETAVLNVRNEYVLT